MAIAFHNILIPVDFSLNTEIAVGKAAELAGREGAELHLLHVLRGGNSVERAFKSLEEMILTRYPEVRAVTHAFPGHSVQGMIIECAGLLRPDLIIIGKTDPPGRWSWGKRVSPDVIATRSHCPVLTVKPGSADNRPRVILIPIRDFLPERKLEWAILLAKRYRAQVHLLAIQDQQETEGRALSQVFLMAYHQLREHLHHPIAYSSAGRHAMAKAALHSAELTMADIIVVNPETESRVPGFVGYRHLSDLLGRDSKLQVLDVSPYSYEQNQN